MEKDPSAWNPQLTYGPITLSNHLRDTMPFKKAGSLYFLIGVPLLFAALYFVLTIASLSR